MAKIRNAVRRFVAEESGATMIEYGLMVALIAVVAIAGATLLGGEVNDKFTNVGNRIESAGS